MAKTAITTGSVSVSGDGLQVSTYTPPGFPNSNTNAPGGVPQPYALASAVDTLIPIPAGAQYMVLVPPVGSTVAKRLKDSATPGDVGFLLANALPSIIPLGAAQTQVRILAANPGETVSIAWGQRMQTRKAIEAERAWLARRLRQKRHACPFDPSIPRLEARIRRIDEALAMVDYWRLKAS